MTADADPSRRMVVSVDMERYSRQDNETQHRSQRIFQQVMRAACDELGLDRVRWSTQLGGDGELAILPPDVPERRVVGEFVFVLDRLLARENKHRAAEARVRLRVAIHEGLVHLDGAAGFPGEAVVTVCRLVDASELKAALRAFRQASVALIVSEEIYRGVVLAYRRPRPDRFRRIDVDMPEKEFQSGAWIFVPDEDVTGPGPAPEPPPPSQPEPPPQAATQSFQVGEVNARNVAFGNRNQLS